VERYQGDCGDKSEQRALDCRSVCSSEKLEVCANYVCVEMDDSDRTLGAMTLEELMATDEEIVHPTEQGA
jgi:hypothetical protein